MAFYNSFRMFPPECFCHMTTPADRQVRLEYFRQLFLHDFVPWRGLLLQVQLRRRMLTASGSPQSVAHSTRPRARETMVAPGSAAGSPADHSRFAAGIPARNSHVRASVNTASAECEPLLCCLLWPLNIATAAINPRHTHVVDTSLVQGAICLVNGTVDLLSILPGRATQVSGRFFFRIAAASLVTTHLSIAIHP